jgi:hypothetical protein
MQYVAVFSRNHRTPFRLTLAGSVRRCNQTMQSAGPTPPIKAVALLGNLCIRWDALGTEHGVRGIRLFCPA